MSENIYRKTKSGKYEPIGLSYDYLPDGIWFIRHHDHCISRTNVSYLEGLYKLFDIDDLKDIKQLCSLQEYTDFILDSDELHDIIDNEKGYTINELVSMCVSLVFKKNKIRKRKRK